MKNLWKVLQACTLALMCTLALGIGMKAEAAAPGKVTGVKQTYSSTGSIEVTWDAVLGNDVEYKVELCANKNFTGGIKDNMSSWGGTSSTSENMSGLTPGRKYYVRVTAYYDSGYPDYIYTYGAPSDVVEVVTKPSSKVTELRETNATETSITMSWKKAEGANAYRIEYQKAGNTSSKRTVNVGNVSSYTVKGLDKNSEYWFYVYPVNKSQSGYSAEGYDTYNSYVPTLPTKISKLDCEFWNPSSNYLELSFNENRAVDGGQYEVYAYNGRKAVIRGTWSGTKTNPYFSHKKLKGYKFLKIRARHYINVQGKAKYGKWSDWEYFARQPEIKIKKVSGGLKLSWSKVSGANNYTVYMSTKQKSGYKKVTATKKTSYTVKKWGKSKLKNNKKYYFSVVANRKVGKKTYKSDDTYCWYMTYIK